MNASLSRSFAPLLLVPLLALAGCDSGGTAVSGPAGTEMIANDFTFPEVDSAGDTLLVSPGNDFLPSFSARRKLSSGTGNRIAFGDPVVLDYRMYSWSSGALVESSDQIDEPVTLRAGINEGAPAYLTRSLVGRSIGDTLQIVFEQGMSDLPDRFDDSDAYLVVVELM